MLSEEKILRYVKRQLGHPFNLVEIDDATLIQDLTDFVLKKDFSDKTPVTKYIHVNTDDVTVQTGIDGEYKINDADNASIYDVVELVYDVSDQLMLGHPYTGVFSYDGLPDWYLSVTQARMTQVASDVHRHYHFKHPNRVCVRPQRFDRNFICIYEAEHISFETIERFRESVFLDLCLAYAKLNLATIRNMYQNLETPFGTINLNAPELKTEGQELWDKSMEKLNKIHPNIMIDFS